MSLVGVLILFRWGMPFRVPTGGAVSIIIEARDQHALAMERIYTILGYVGLLLLILGTALQMFAVLVTSHPPTTPATRCEDTNPRTVTNIPGG